MPQAAGKNFIKKISKISKKIYNCSKSSQNMMNRRTLYHLYSGFNEKYLLYIKNVNFVPLVPDVFKIVSSMWNNTSLIKNPEVVVTNPKLWDGLIKD